jgi:twitching motility protein PilT
MARIEQLLREMVRQGASDIHVKVGGVPAFRVNGDIKPAGTDKVGVEVMDEYLGDLMNRTQRARFEKTGEFDFAVGAGSLGRFRVNAFRSRGGIGLVIRHIRPEIPDFGSLGLPQVLLRIAMKKRGLILVTGTTGSGKSTTLASMIHHINCFSSGHIITIEDPIEYAHFDQRCIVTQREVGQDTENFAAALRAAMRQDPDVILVGEIRDLETFQIALTAADTGHLVLATIHTTNASETIKRILSMYQPHQHEEVRRMLGTTLESVVSLRLLPSKDGKSRVPAVEVMLNTAAIRDYIMDPDKFSIIEKAIAEGYSNPDYRSQTFDQSIYDLLIDNQISREVAIINSSNPNDFQLRLQGIEGASDRTWMR